MKKILKKETDAPYVDKKKTDTIVCGACGHVRKGDEQNPIWQCPECLMAYNKVNKKKAPYTKDELKKKNEEYLQRKSEEEKVSPLEKGTTGLEVGVTTFFSGLGTACSMGNPFVQIIGAIIAVGSISYIVSNIFGN
ncbi:MAG: hypothetical protein OEY19_05095 [Gammaproteobacteria bacterium]|nr:hypothetical protein [Gammaproteobacteria bacterium]MDH5630817.1 hypothetical protein [Gammaproteobacteria bacterium]